jgi:hypothetical protein
LLQRGKDCRAQDEQHGHVMEYLSIWGLVRVGHVLVKVCEETLIARVRIAYIKVPHDFEGHEAIGLGPTRGKYNLPAV